MSTENKIDDKINSYDDWRGELLIKLRQLINDTAPDLTEDFKWNVPVWSQNGLVCAISAFKEHVKMNFFKGAYLPDPSGLFNSGLDSKEHRSINFAETDKVDTNAIKDLILAAISYNEKG